MAYPPPPWKMLNLDPLRLLLMQSGTNLQHILATIITILNFKISGRGENSRAPTPLYETLLEPSTCCGEPRASLVTIHIHSARDVRCNQPRSQASPVLLFSLHSV